MHWQLLIILLMNNEGRSHQSFQEPPPEDVHHTSPMKSSRSSLQQSANEEARGREHEIADGPLLHLPQAILESSREGGNGSWEEGDTSRQHQEPLPQQIDISKAQTYYRIGPNGEREIIRVTAINPPMPPHGTISIASPQHMGPSPVPPHYPPSPRVSHPPPQKPPQIKSLDNMRKVTQQSFAPSQKTIVLNHISNQINSGVYHSHVSTERMPTLPQREANTRHSHVHDARVGSPARVNFDYNQSKPEPLFSSYIPTSGIVVQRGASSHAPQASDRLIEHPEEVSYWRSKYEELGRRWEATRAKQAKQQEVALSKFAALQNNYQLLQANYDQLVQEYHVKLDQNQQYFQQIQQLQSVLNQLQLKRDSDDGEGRNVSFRRENEQLKGRLNALQGELAKAEQRHQHQLREMHEHAIMLQMELQQKEAQLHQRHLKTSAMRRSDNSQLILDRSRMDSFENTRLMELEIHVGKLNAELTMREESYQRELKLANVSVGELADRLRAVTAEKDQIIRTLQEKVGLLEGDLNRKDSLLRNLRDEIARPAQPAASVYSSAVGPMEARVGEREDAARRELEAVRRTLLERERQKMVLKQKYEQLEQRIAEDEESLARRKQENQAMRRQLNDLEGLRHDNQQLKEVLANKNAELKEMRDMLREKDQHAGDFENLSKENEKLRGIIVKRNEELADLTSRFHQEQKRARQAELAHSPHLRELEEEIGRMQDAIARKDLQIDKLNQSLQLVESNFSQVQFELQRHKNITQEYEVQMKNLLDKANAYENELKHQEAHLHQQEQELIALHTHIQQIETDLQQERTELEQAKRELQAAKAELAARREELEMVAEERIELREFKQKSTKEIQQFEFKQGDLQVRCRELESQLRNRQQRLTRLQREVEDARDQLKRHHGCARQKEQMSERIAQYEMRIISLTLNRTSGLSHDLPPTEIFQNKLIYSLKQQNESLKMELLAREEGTASSRQPSEKGGSIKERLGQFGNRLESAIGGGLKRVKSVQALIGRQEDKQLAEQQRVEIERLKQLAQQMQLQQLLEGSSSNRKGPSPQHLQQLYQEELDFLRSSNHKLEERNSELLRLNKELKQQLEDSLIQKSTSLKIYYEEEVKRMQREVAQLRAQNGRGSQVVRGCERRVRQLEQEVQRLRRVNAALVPLGHE